MRNPTEDPFSFVAGLPELYEHGSSIPVRERELVATAPSLPVFIELTDRLNDVLKPVLKVYEVKLNFAGEVAGAAENALICKGFDE
jgi:hypothetical protein